MPFKHGDAKRSGFHRLYNIRRGMLERCYNPHSASYERYGGRGITVCDEWRENYKSFKEWALSTGYEDGLSIDRIDNNGNYCPENCRWADNIVQGNNKNNITKYEFRGEQHSLAEWARILNLSRGLLKDRIVIQKWDVEKAFTTPPRKCQPIEYNGEVHTWEEWSEITGITKATLQARYYTLRWNIEEVLTTPLEWTRTIQND